MCTKDISVSVLLHRTSLQCRSCDDDYSQSLWANMYKCWTFQTKFIDTWRLINHSSDFRSALFKFFESEFTFLPGKRFSRYLDLFFCAFSIFRGRQSRPFGSFVTSRRQLQILTRLLSFFYVFFFPIDKRNRRVICDRIAPLNHNLSIWPRKTHVGHV